VSASLATYPEWPCRAGCDHCCRHLAAVPIVTEAEWTVLSSAIGELPEPIQNAVNRRIRALDDASYPFTCPILDTASGRCLVYEERPLACRVYGFYVDRADGLYCQKIRSLADAGQLDDVTWGSQAGIDQKSAALGIRRSLAEWLRLDSDGG
jgi:uncharacterized protein